MSVNCEFTTAELDTIKSIQSCYNSGAVGELESVRQISIVLGIRLCKRNIDTLVGILYADYQ